MDDSRKLLCLLLHAQPRLGLNIIEQLLQRFPCPQSFWSARRIDLPITSSTAINSVLLQLWRTADRCREWQQALQWQQQLQQQDIHLLCPLDSDYPALLRDIPDRPGALYVRGDVTALALPQLAVVGSRSASRSGLRTAMDFARELAAAGFAISSGLALGIDGAAHQGALESAGVSIAVLGTGIDRIYPRRHGGLAEKILVQGALVSEFPLATPPLPRHFPRRNRILAGMSLGTLVVEAAAKSGSLITARLALDYNREVFAIPGSIHNPNSKGSHSLIRDGAKLVETTSHIVEELGGLLQLVAMDTAAATQVAPDPAGLEPHLAMVLDAIDYHVTSFDAIVERSGVASAQLGGYLLELELGQWVDCVSGAWQRCR